MLAAELGARKLHQLLLLLLHLVPEWRVISVLGTAVIVCRVLNARARRSEDGRVPDDERHKAQDAQTEDGQRERIRQSRSARTEIHRTSHTQREGETRGTDTVCCFSVSLCPVLTQIAVLNLNFLSVCPVYDHTV